MGKSKYALFFLLTLTFTAFTQTKPTADIEAYLKGADGETADTGLVGGGRSRRQDRDGGAYGTANIPDNAPVTNRTVFPIKSTTKTFPVFRSRRC